MLKIKLHPGDFIDIGENVRVVFSGGSANNIHLLIDAPRDMNIARSTASKDKKPSPYYAAPKLSSEAQKEIVDIIKKEKQGRRKTTPTPKGN